MYFSRGLQKLYRLLAVSAHHRHGSSLLPTSQLLRARRASDRASVLRMGSQRFGKRGNQSQVRRYGRERTKKEVAGYMLAKRAIGPLKKHDVEGVANQLRSKRRTLTQRIDVMVTRERVDQGCQYATSAHRMLWCSAWLRKRRCGAFGGCGRRTCCGLSYHLTIHICSKRPRTVVVHSTLRKGQ